MYVQTENNQKTSGLCMDCANARANVCCWVASNGRAVPKEATAEKRHIERYQGRKLIQEDRIVLLDCPYRKTEVKPPRYSFTKVRLAMQRTSKKTLMRMGFQEKIIRKWKERVRRINNDDFEEAAMLLEAEGIDVAFEK